MLKKRNFAKIILWNLKQRRIIKDNFRKNKRRIILTKQRKEQQWIEFEKINRNINLAKWNFKKWKRKKFN